MSTTAPISAGSMPSSRLWAAYFREMRFEFLKALRTPAFSVPTLFFPIMFYLLFGVVLAPVMGGDAALTTYVRFGVFAAMGPGLFGFGVSIAMEREFGLLRLKQALPQPAGAYLLARAAMTMLFVAIIAVMLTILALTLGKVDLGIGQLAQLFLIDVLGALPFCAIGMYLGWILSGQGAPAVINFVFLPMAFLSGIFIPLQAFPGFIQAIAPAFPSYHLAQMAMQVAGKPSVGTSTTHLAVLAGTTLLFFVLAVRRMQGSGFRLLGRNPRRTVVVAVLAASAIVGASFLGVFGGKPAETEDATAATDAASAATDTPTSQASNDVPADETAPAEPLIAGFDAGSDHAAYGQGLFASGDENQQGKSTATQKVIDGGAQGSKGALEVTGEVRPGAQYPTAGTFFFAKGQVMKSTIDISAKKTLSFQVRGDGKDYTLMIFTAASYIPLMQAVSTGPEWREVKLDLSKYVGADFKHVKGFGIVAMAMGPFRFQVDDLRLE
ncbi:MAG TPA: ABC transporter permease [Steroidobacteraceae bacterium]|nr:ABC transporter permease [Steroidobacteraceae bacterium]